MGPAEPAVTAEAAGAVEAETAEPGTEEEEDEA